MPDKYKVKYRRLMGGQEQSLHQVVMSGNLDEVRRYLENHEYIDSSNSDGLTPLHLAMISDFSQKKNKKNFEPIAPLLLEKGAKINYKDGGSMTALHIAAMFGENEYVDLCINAGIDVNAISTKEGTPLHVAAQGNYLTTVRKLLEYHADPTIRNKDGKIPCDMTDNYEIKKMLCPPLCRVCNP